MTFKRRLPRGPSKFKARFGISGIWCTVDQFSKKRVLLPQTLDISFSGVHGNKKFLTVEGPEVVRWGKGLTWLGLGVEASRKFYFGIVNFPVPERIQPAHMWIREQAQGSGNLFSDSKFSGDIFAGAKGLAGGLGGLGWKGGCPGNSFSTLNFAASPCEARLGGGMGLAEGL